MYVSYRRRGTLTSVFILHYCSSTGTCQPYKYCYIIFMYHSMRFYMVYSHWLWQLPQTALYLDIIITDYYVIHICNLEQIENKVTYLLYLVSRFRFYDMPMELGMARSLALKVRFTNDLGQSAFLDQKNIERELYKYKI